MYCECELHRSNYQSPKIVIYKIQKATALKLIWNTRSRKILCFDFMQKTFLTCFPPESVANCTIQRLAFQIHCMSNPVYTVNLIVCTLHTSIVYNSLFISNCKMNTQVAYTLYIAYNTSSTALHCQRLHINSLHQIAHYIFALDCTLFPCTGLHIISLQWIAHYFFALDC